MMMLQLVNLSNYTTDLELVHNDPLCLQAFLTQHRLDGLEMMFCGPWDGHIHKKDWIQGAHLRFWPCWLDFWREDRERLMNQFGSEENIVQYYGSLSRDGWLDIYRENIRTAVRAGARYLVFHVSHAGPDELFTWRFRATDRNVVDATIEVINELAGAIPDEVELLFENLWWPGLTLRNRELAVGLLENIRHKNAGIMLDTGHLMNTNPALKTEDEGIEYILAVISQLGDCDRYIRGIHLHRSLSGQYILNSRSAAGKNHTPAETMKHVLKIDEHLPFSTPQVRRIIERVRPEYLVHEFLTASLNDWGQKVMQQQQTLRSGTPGDGVI
jgi:hypothetical protein